MYVSIEEVGKLYIPECDGKKTPSPPAYHPLTETRNKI